jgi:imidazolonepropionase-like amidohydrolase
MTLAIKSKILIDGTGKEPFQDGVLLIEGDRIVDVGSPQAVRIPAQAEILDLGDQTLLPGLIDVHSHISLPAQLRSPAPVRALWITRNLRRYLKSGATTIRVVGEFNFLDVYCKQAVKANVIPGPRLLVSGIPLDSSSGHGLGVTVDGIEAVRKAVRENIKGGADLIKIFVTPSLTAVDAQPTDHYYSQEEIAMAVEEAHRAGKRVAAHAHGGPGLRYCLEARVDTIEHGAYITPADIELFVYKGAWLVCTYGTLYHKDGLEKTRFQDEVAKAKILQARTETPERFRWAYEAGVKYTVGTDNMIGLLAFELECLVKFGVPPMEAIVAATRRAAEACGVEDRVGTLEAGKLADCISVKGSPLQDVRVLHEVGLVMKGGRRYDTLSTQ